MKKLFTLLLAAVLVVACCFGLTACGGKSFEEMKVGLICLHDENSTYDKNFIDAFKEACKAKGISEDRYFIKTGINEDNSAYDAAADLVDQGCNLIFADSFGHEEFILKAAKEFSDVQFCHATGTMAHTENVKNFHNAFASIYEGRYLAGVVAGQKLKAMNETKVGYVGAYPYAEVKSGYTAFFLGIRSIVPNATMEVQFTNDWYKPTAEKAAAENLISRGAKLISQHADSMGAPDACEAAGVPNVSYNGSTATACPNTFLVSSRINWAPYYEYCMDCVNTGKAIDYDWAQGIGSTLTNGSVCLTELGTAVADGTQAALNAAVAKLKAGKKVFDCADFTVGGKHITSYLADVNNHNFAHDTEAIVKDGDTYYFAESSLRSAPYFDIDIDGITVLTAIAK